MVSAIPSYRPRWRRFPFGLIDFRWMEKNCWHEHLAVDTKVWAIPSSNCAARFVLAEYSGGKFHGDYERTCQTHTDERTRETRTDSRDPTVACLLACHDRQPADQRHGSRNGQAVPGSHQLS